MGSLLGLRRDEKPVTSNNPFEGFVLLGKKIGDTIFYVSYCRRDCHFAWSSEPRKGLTACSAKAVTSFFSYFKTLSVGPAPGIEHATSRSAVTRFTD